MRRKACRSATLSSKGDRSSWLLIRRVYNICYQPDSLNTEREKILGKVLFVCGENSARSQMAEALFNHLARSWRADSAGTLPGPAVNPLAVQVMAERGIDISQATPKALDLSGMEDYERIISFGCIVKSVFPVAERLEEWPLDDPAGGDAGLMRRIRDDIYTRVLNLVRDLEPDQAP
jgi:arsenate reductase